ncbi:Lrp/AsnC family transcriptional regulator [Gilvimarinus agarilyticus]|uniref:DNA-binding transcriptional regulator, Lrp family n=1 Tax=Reichenbachiella agariperforans TaxID=156994 RepID=A0A1M6MY08_REIAG|nr:MULTISPECIES: Lrp/AsnC family transcriptional regulator [Reichenbachiella]MBU2888017.1 Lrp/AsnC family transcriptional regulator [Gilvimarinus agarilyticus]MBU2915632.1 Lrp/AsnC family transcriptional regulator [Reichenbachiella agariperforans]RJE72092.1 AsnC family transcriptional regulator [Reichenbachiella sp. MSK19-1]SHJ88329.1 DNA-binding transcriptional regulator, Lrp family [Reichenbachiella agariperforans]
MKANFKIDKTDRKILKILQTNGKITNAKLSEEVGLSPAPTLERVKKLEQAGIIKSYHAELNAEMLGLGVNTFVQVSLKGHNKQNIDSFLSRIEKIDEVVECHHITGSGDFILKVMARDIASYQLLMLEQVSDIDVVDSLQSMVILSTFKNNKEIPLPQVN